MKRLALSSNRRFLIWEDGSSFFWLADTAWELFHRTTIEEAEFYLEHRRQQGFTVVQAVALAEFDGLNIPNAYGERPLIDNDPRRPNEAYFRYIDNVIELAAQKGILVGLLPTWGDKLELLAHGKGPLIFDLEKARRYGEWIGNRYREFWNIVWINGGDRQGGGSNLDLWEALARGVKSADPNHLMTFHPLGAVTVPPSGFTRPTGLTSIWRNLAMSGVIIPTLKSSAAIITANHPNPAWTASLGTKITG
jgi:hypothetical protein